MKETIYRRALELGFDDCRFTTAAAPASAEQFQNWLAQKNHGEMAYLERNSPKRIDPQKVLPGANSVICLRERATKFPLRNPQSAIRNLEKLPATPGLMITTMFLVNG